jgi:hypothetical protein
MSLLLALLACAPDYNDAPVKLVGVGYDPEEIGPSPTPLGGVVEYSWINFAGGGLSLAAMQLGSFDEIGPNMSGFAPPYAAVYGFSYIFSEKLAAADSLGGVTSVPPEAEDSCYTTFEATGPIGSFKMVDVGDHMAFSTEDGTGGMRIDRYPPQYPPDNQDSYAYYFGVDLWTQQPQYSLVPGEDEDISKMDRRVLRPATFPSREVVHFQFPGGTIPANAPLGSIPVPSTAVEATDIRLPSFPGGVQLEWNGARYDSFGNEVASSGGQRTCLGYAGGQIADPQSASECADADLEQSQEGGQMYTGPWDTEDGALLLRWEPNESDSDEYVHIAVRFLGPIDEDDPNYQEEFVSEEAPDEATDRESTIKAKWKGAQGEGTIPSDAEIPEGRRAPTACEDDGEFAIDDAFLDSNGDFLPALQGDPFHNMAEVTCRMKDDGEFALTQDIVRDAYEYALAHGSGGVVFYFGRSVEAQVAVPAAMDNYGNRSEISPIGVASRAIDIGRFWWEE